MITYRLVFTIISFFLAPLLLFAQEQLPLVDVLRTLESRHNASFSYADEDIAGRTVMQPPESLRFRESINFLKARLNLKFTFINDRQVTISPIRSGDVICGFVENASGKPIENTRIQYGNITVLTDTQGKFNLKLQSDIPVLKIWALGFETLTIDAISLSDTPCQKIVMIDLNDALPEVVLRSYIARGIEILDDGGVGINFKDFSILPGVIEADALLSIQALPGIQSVNETVSDINIRGGTPDQNLILWDGIKMYQSGHFFGLISAFNPLLNDQARVYKNGTPAQYGDGVSGTISLVSENQHTQQLSAGIDINLINAGGFIDIPIGKKSSAKVSARTSLSDVIETTTYQQYFDRAFQNSEVTSANGNMSITDDIFSFQDVNFRWLYKPTNKDQIQINGLYMSNRLLFQEQIAINDETTSNQSSATQNNYAGGFIYHRQWNEQWKTKAQLTISDYTLNAVNFDLINDQRLFQENNVIESSLRLETTQTLNKTGQLIGGYQFVETGITNVQDINNPVFRRSIKEVIRSHAAYGTYSKMWNNKHTRLALGTRINYYDKLSELTIEPRLVFSQYLFNTWTMTLSGERKSQVTSQVVDVQSDFLGIDNRRWVLANGLDIPLLTSDQIALGFNYSKKGWLFNVEGYYKKVDGLTTQSQGFQNQLQAVRSTGNYEVKGVDLLVRKQWRKWNARLGYSFGVNNYDFDTLPDGIETAFPNDLDIRHALKGAIAYDHKNVKAGISVFYRTGRPMTTLDTPDIINDQLNFAVPNNVRLPNYFRVDFSASYQVKWSNHTRSEFGLSLWNITNSSNDLRRSYFIENDTPSIITERGLGLTLNTVVKFIFF